MRINDSHRFSVALGVPWQHPLSMEPARNSEEAMVLLELLERLDGGVPYGNGGGKPFLHIC